MKNKKIISVLLAASMMFGLAACGSDSSSGNDADNERVTTEAETEDSEETTSETTTESEEPTESTLREPEGPVESEFFTDFENMSFTYNGNTYTLGVSTLQDLIDDGVELSGLDAASDIVDSQSTYYAGFSIELIPYRSATMTVANYTDEELPASDCVITSLSVESIREIPEGTIEFNFPDLFTAEDLVNSAGEPDNLNEFEISDGTPFAIYTYEQSSEIYYGYRRYEYTFENGVIDDISMSYIP
ncbi:hypothetical protein SAMN06296952_2754 [Oscillospiraceae bacterium]|nr:hypothetical protein SAMN06296952_2754 [Oscillospiraceae bacterium]